jgi:glycosyltransferase involved in cell wall biosynthesis
VTVDPIRHVTVVIPARDEAAALSRTLRSIDHALSSLPCGTTGECVVVLDSCRDHSARVTADALTQWRSPSIVLETDVACAGAARELGSRVALERAAHDVRHIWLANTDADTVVPADWLNVQLDLADHGADAVAGIVELDVDADDRLRRAFGASYRLGRDGTHRHVHGANLGVRADVYRAVGGWRHLRTGEDHDLWKRLLAAGRCVSATASVVRTSGRLAGRAPHGFAADLATIVGQGQTVA